MPEDPGAGRHPDTAGAGTRGPVPIVPAGTGG
jgi:hypothetical protein